MPKIPVAVALTALIGISVIAFSRFEREHTSAPQQPAIHPTRVLAVLAHDQHFEPVSTSTELEFPADHGPHPESRTEWWYLTGTLHTQHGVRLGVQLVFMRVGLVSQPQRRVSHWATTQLLAGLFSVSDPEGEGLHSEQRASRAALGLAGAKAEPVRIWIDDWHLAQTASAESGQDLTARVAMDRVSLALALRNLKPLVEATDIRRQQSDTFAPFRFYIRPRLAAVGSLRVGHEDFPVTGTLAMEHAWGELPLPGGPVALDRFMLHLSDGRELFCVRTHRVDGSGTPETTALLVAEDGRALALPSRDVELKPTEHWVSKRTGARYPIGWVLSLPTQGITLELLPQRKNQEGSAGAPFWASAVRLRGTASSNSALSGDGFVQLNGYHDS